MRDVYKYAFGTTTAAAASDSSTGCFFDREPDFVRAFKVHAPFREKICNLDVFGTEDKIWQSMMDDKLLSRRAWAFQERMLSPRVVYIRQNQMYWVC